VSIGAIFDQGLGDLFVVRSAGAVVPPELIGSVELALENCSTRLVVVMGHTHCGAVQATLDVLQRGDPVTSPNLRAIIDHVRPSVEPLLAADARGARDAILDRAVRANVQASVDRLRRKSEIIDRRVASGDVLVVGAEYALATGSVDFFAGVPDVA
jgi:carbonic anhydrase